MNIGIDIRGIEGFGGTGYGMMVKNILIVDLIIGEHQFVKVMKRGILHLVMEYGMVANGILMLTEMAYGMTVKYTRI